MSLYQKTFEIQKRPISEDEKLFSSILENISNGEIIIENNEYTLNVLDLMKNLNKYKPGPYYFINSDKMLSNIYIFDFKNILYINYHKKYIESGMIPPSIDSLIVIECLYKSTQSYLWTN